jgi:TonB family protein
VVQVGESPVARQIQQPAYPQRALERGIEGSVVLEFGLNADGSVKNVQVVDAKPAGVFDEAAVDAFRRWTFQPSPGLSGTARFRQNLSFTLHGQGSEAGAHAKAGCYIGTGTHVCRSPEDLRMLSSSSPQ